MEHAKTYLFVPGNAPHRFQQAVCCGADAVRAGSHFVKKLNYSLID
ncbi:hypothetical protein [Pectobacterium carotovorum]|nr:hypothetical protein [Pectobacterium carotovorum]